MANYPNQEDYWEIVNKKLLIFLSKLYPSQKKIQSILSIEPDSNKPFSRKSICRIYNGEIEREAFSFGILNYPFMNNLTNLNIEMDYECNDSSNNYINFFIVKDIIEIFTKENNVLDLSESVFIEKIAQHFLSHFTNLKSFSIMLEIPPHASNFKRCSWKATTFREKTTIVNE